MVEEQTMKTLTNAALQARTMAYVPYSHFPVGAAVLGASGRIYRGCNVENASYGLTNCAERTAIYSAVAAGEQNLIALAVVADTQQPTAPCGACRQVIAEFHIGTIIMSNLKGDTQAVTLQELLPYAFKKSDMTGGKNNG